MGLNGQGACDDKALLLPTGEFAACAVEAVLYLVPEAGCGKGLLDDVVVIAALHSRKLQAREDVAPDRHAREGVRLLEDHADREPDVNRIHITRVDVLAFIEDLASQCCPGEKLVQAIERADEGRLAAARRTDERGDGVFREGHVDPLEHLPLPEPHAHIACLKLGRRSTSRRGHLGLHDIDALEFGSGHSVLHFSIGPSARD